MTDYARPFEQPPWHEGGANEDICNAIETDRRLTIAKNTSEARTAAEITTYEPWVRVSGDGVSCDYKLNVDVSADPANPQDDSLLELAHVLRVMAESLEQVVHGARVAESPVVDREFDWLSGAAWLGLMTVTVLTWQLIWGAFL